MAEGGCVPRRATPYAEGMQAVTRGEIVRLAVTGCVSLIWFLVPSQGAGAQGLLGVGPLVTVLNVVAVIAALVAMRWRRAHPVVLAVVLNLGFLLAPAVWPQAVWAYLSLCTHRRWPATIGVGALTVVTSTIETLTNTSIEVSTGSGEAPGPWVLLVASAGLSTLATLVVASVGSYLGARRAEHAALRAQLDAAARERALVEQLGGTYHQVVGDDIPEALVGFARSVNATQLVIGVSRRGRLLAAFTGPGIGATVTRESGDIDVHIVNHAAAGDRSTLPRTGGALSPQRRVLGFLLAALGGPLLTALLVWGRSEESITSDVLSYQLLVVLVALVGGIWPALFSAVLSGIALDYFFIAPLLTITIADPLHLWALLLSVVIAILVSLVVDRAARHTRVARRSAAESELIQTIAGSVLRGDNAIQAVVDRAREAFGLDAVRVTLRGETLAEAGAPEGPATTTMPLTEGAQLELHGPDLEASEQRLLAVVATQLSAALEHQRLSETVEEIEPIAASDRVRGALLSALSHDLRRPLAAATAAVGGLRAAGDRLSDEDRDELLTTADESLAGLAQLVNDLLDVSRLQAGVLTISTMATDPAGAIAPALDELELGPLDVHLALAHGQATAEADPVLLQRVLVNLLANAVRHSPPGASVSVTTSTFGDRLEIRVIDHGPGVAPERMDDIFVPFQRLGDTDNTSGLGLGLALSRGFVEAMHGSLTPEGTPGGGLTMVIALPVHHDTPTEQP